MFDTTEALLFRRADKDTIANNTCGRVCVKCVYSQKKHLESFLVA